MSNEMEFQHLVELFRLTHEQSQRQVAKTIDTSLVVRNWLFGWYIVEFEQAGAKRAEYGAQFLKKLSASLSATRMKGVSETRLKLFRSFYQIFPAIRPTLSDELGPTLSIKHLQIGSTPSDEFKPITSLQQTMSVESRERLISAIGRKLACHLPLSWSHYVTLLAVANADERRFYEIESEANDWSVRELKRQINSSLYERLALSRDKDEFRRLAQEGQIVERAADLIKNPYVLEFLELDERATWSETDLETAIIDKLEHFLLELGKGFLFEARQKRFTFDEDHYFVDLVFYNRLLRCYTLIDLKIGELTHQDLGQMQMYVNYYDRHVKLPEENSTIGIILCKRKKDALVEITLPKDANIHASEYQLYLPSKAELKAQLDAVEIDGDRYRKRKKEDEE